MKGRLLTLPATILAALLAGCLTAMYLTRDAGSSPKRPDKTSDAGPSPVNSDLLRTATRLTALAETTEEQDDAREALRLADHELDQAFASALRQAAEYKPPASGPLGQLTARVNQLKAIVAEGKERVAQLTKQVASADADQLELANAQLALAQDDLEDAQQDLSRQGGDPRAALQRALQEHDAIQHQSSPTMKGGPPSTDTLSEQLRAWLDLRSAGEQVFAAERQATSHAATVVAQHNQLEKQTDDEYTGQKDTVAGLRKLSEQRKTLAELDQRIQDSQQLARVYRDWGSLIQVRRRAVLHLVLSSVAIILTILFLAVLANIAVRRLFRQTEKKRVQQARIISAVGIQFVAAALILLVVFGAPNQLSTILGLATAGLTVVLRDFIVAFLGWFTLMGKNGIRVGDWVEINGVSGEVIEIGVLKTVLLESGNWTDTGHPTGRQVAFSNSFAMEGHYFNFSTAGQWLWDELEVTLPATGDPYQLAEDIGKLVERETAADSAQAAQDWERVTRRYGAHSFSAKPAVNLRPVAAGLQVAVRYITRAPQRYAIKSRLFQLIVELLHKPAGTGGGDPDPALAQNIT